jgi:hypothetical protein
MDSTRIHPRAAAVALLLLCVGDIAYAQTLRASRRSTPVRAARVDQDVRVDGKLDEPFWRLVRPAGRFVQTEPNEGASPSKATDVRLVFTDEAVIIGVRLADDRHVLTEATRAGTSLTNGYLPDYFRVQIDPHRDHHTVFEFIVTLQGDTRAGLSTSTGATIDSWAITWDAATHVDEDGWTVEIRIPLSEMHVEKGSENWGIAFQRFSWKRMETDVLDGRGPPPRVAAMP